MRAAAQSQHPASALADPEGADLVRQCPAANEATVGIRGQDLLALDVAPEQPVARGIPDRAFAEPALMAPEQSGRRDDDAAAGGTVDGHGRSGSFISSRTPGAG